MERCSACDMPLGQRSGLEFFSPWDAGRLLHNCKISWRVYAVGLLLESSSRALKFDECRGHNDWSAHCTTDGNA